MTDQNDRNAQQPSSQSSMPADTRGAVDLSSLAADSHAGQRGGGPVGTQRPVARDAGQGGEGGTDSWVISVQPQQIQQVLQYSSQAPVVLIIHDDGEASAQRRSALEDHVDAQQGRILLAEVDASAQPEIAQSAGQLPVVTAFLGGRPVGEWDASLPVEQIGELVSQIVQAATQSGMTQKLPPQSTRNRGAEEGEPEEPSLPPLHQKAHEALEQGDLDGAAAAYEEALRESPGDDDARLGLSQVELMRRTAGLDVAAVRQEAAEAPDDVAAQIRVADVDVLGGHVEDALARLVTFIRAHVGEDRETAREHLVELYRVVGDTDPRVDKSRRQLARALF